MGASGQTTISAGAIGTQTNEVVVSIAGQTGILAASSEVDAWVQPKATAEHSVDEHRIEQLTVDAYNVVDGVGFDIALRCENGRLYGGWNVAWAWA